MVVALTTTYTHQPKKVKSGRRCWAYTMYKDMNVPPHTSILQRRSPAANLNPTVVSTAVPMSPISPLFRVSLELRLLLATTFPYAVLKLILGSLKLAHSANKFNRQSANYINARPNSWTPTLPIYIFTRSIRIRITSTRFSS